MRRTVIDISKIKIFKNYLKTPIKEEKLRERRYYYFASGKFEREVFINSKGYLIGGYSTYLLAKEDNLTTIEVILASKAEKRAYNNIKNKIEHLEWLLCNKTFGIFNKWKLKLKIEALEEVKEEMFENER